MKFQFHKGTIKTTKGQFEKGRAKTFQFHKGTIKTKNPYFAGLAFQISIP